MHLFNYYGDCFGHYCLQRNLAETYIERPKRKFGLMWFVRAGEHGRLFDDFHKKQMAAIGWKELGDLSGVSANQIRELILKAYPNKKRGYVNMSTGQVTKFRFEMKKGERIVTYDPERRKYLVGEIDGDYKHDNSAEYPNVRSVNWIGEVSRDDLSASTKNKLGSISTLFQVDSDAEKEIVDRLEGQGHPTEPEVEHEELHEAKEDMLEKAHELIKDSVIDLDWDEAQNLVAGILRSMGYKTIVSPRGPDRGRDVMASPDGLGLDDPRIIVQVKHREGQVGRGDLTSFTGGLRPGAKGLYVSTGGFTKEARMEADRAQYPMTLVGLDELVDLIIQYYDGFDSETKALMPLTKIYWPA